MKESHIFTFALELTNLIIILLVDKSYSFEDEFHVKLINFRYESRH